jgi:hypothetical protein
LAHIPCSPSNRARCAFEVAAYDEAARGSSSHRVRCGAGVGSWPGFAARQKNCVFVTSATWRARVECSQVSKALGAQPLSMVRANTAAAIPRCKGVNIENHGLGGRFAPTTQYIFITSYVELRNNC